MPRYAQQKFDGLPFDKVKGRFSGSFEVEDDEANLNVVDDVMVHIVVSRVGGATAKLNRKGEFERTNLFELTDARLVMDKEVKDFLIEKFGLVGTDTLFSYTPPPPPAPEAELPADVAALADPTTGEYLPEADGPEDDPPDDDDPMPDEDEWATPVAPVHSGPRVAAYKPGDDGGAPVGERVASIYDRPRDTALASFLDEPRGA